MAAAQAILESLEIERPDLFGFLRSLPTDDSISHEEKMGLTRHLIRQDYENYASGLPPPLSPPTCERSASEYEAYELAMKLEQEELDKRMAFKCCICMEESPIDGCYTLDCSHRFCAECLKNYIRSKINSNETSPDQLVCPAGCGTPVSLEVIRGCTADMGDKDLYEKFDNFVKEKFIENAVRAGGCMRCPNELCNYAFMWNPDGSNLPFKCMACSSEYCFNCSVVSGGIGPGHRPYTCTMQVERNKELAEEKRKLEEWKELNGRVTQLFDQMVAQNGWKSKISNCTCIEFFNTDIISTIAVLL